MNLLPIPALDGGHIAFLFYEIIVGKPAPEKFVENAQVVGMVLLFSLLIFANGNDILRLFKHGNFRYKFLYFNFWFYYNCVVFF